MSNDVIRLMCIEMRDRLTEIIKHIDDEDYPLSGAIMEKIETAYKTLC